MVRRKRSRRWFSQHRSDEFVRQSWNSGYRSRAVFKLLEIDQHDRLLQRGGTVVDLGASPGGWSQLAAARVSPNGRVVALDVLPMEPVSGVEFLLGDISVASVQETLVEKVGARAAGLVLSDMAPNLSGISAIDQPRVIALAELVLVLCERILAPGGGLLIKVFQGEGYQAYLEQLRDAFRTVSVRKPRASRAQSREVFLLGQFYRW